MSDQFTGRTVRVTLADRTQLRGTVGSVANGLLTLADVLFLNTGKTRAHAVVAAADIQDLDLLPSSELAPSAAGTAFADPAVIAAVPSSTPSRDLESSSDDDSITDAIAYDFQQERRQAKKQAASASASATPSASAPATPRSQRKKNKRAGKHENGHAAATTFDSDVSSIKGTEFDFESNLRAFDKAKVFAEIREQDHVDAAQRLVSHNVQRRPAASDKYKNSEMVLPQAGWNSIDADDSSREHSRTREGAAEPAEPRPSTVRRPSRQLPAKTLSFVCRNTGAVCPAASPLQLIELDRLLGAGSGLSDSAIDENGGRGIAQFAIQLLGGASRFAPDNHNARPVVAFLTGNNRIGARAVAAARHLVNRKVKVVIATTPRNKSDEFVTAQLRALECAPKSDVEVVDNIAAFEMAVRHAAPELVIDSLQGYLSTLDDLSDDDDGDFALVKSLIEWTNANKAAVISLEIPSGIDAAAGTPSSLGLFVDARWVLSCGFPLSGLLNAQLAGTTEPNQFIHYVLDVGYPLRSSKVASGKFKRFSKLWFGCDWLLALDVEER